MRLAYFFFFMALSPCLAAQADDFKPRVCSAAVEYVGDPLHPPLPHDALSGLAAPCVGALDGSLVKKLEAVVDWILTNSSAPGITAAVGLPGKGLWSTSRGMAATSPPTPLAEQPYFHWASVGKMFTAAIAMQLVEEGKLGYADPLARWFPDFPNAGAITIDHLLTHTNGIFSFNTDLKFRGEKGYHAPDKLLRIAASHGCVCCPGERWYYSNTGYVLLGRIIEKIEGQPLHIVAQSRLIAPIGLKQTIAFTPNRPPQSLAIGHVGKKPDHDFEPTTPFGAGNIAATAHDMVLFWQAMLSGTIVPQATVERAFARLYPMFEPGLFYGRGVMLFEFQDKDREKILWLGHSGGTPGIKAVVAYDVRAKLFLAVAINGDVSAEATANKLRQTVIDHHAAH